MNEVDAAVCRIVRFSNAWGRLSEDFRHCRLRRFPYAVIYTRDSDGGVLVVSVFHQSREPLFWKRGL